MLLLNINIIIISKVEVNSEFFSFFFWNFCESNCLNENKAVNSLSEGYYIGPPLHGYGVWLLDGDILCSKFGIANYF